MHGGLWILCGEAVKTSAGFFWKSGWAFVLGYFIIFKRRFEPFLGNHLNGHIPLKVQLMGPVDLTEGAFVDKLQNYPFVLNGGSR